MFTLDYRLDAYGAAIADKSNLATVDPATLRYHLFPGDVVVRGEGADFSAPWGWVPVLDFALCLSGIGQQVERDGEARFEFTESTAVLEFTRDETHVAISASYAPGVLRIERSEFADAVARFERRVVDELCARYPRLAQNAELQRTRGGR
ncbi:MAG TPA: hypothetical protein VMZ28_04225 [Kofleriaceae bacterium]|nr:hypothetical protein [Kofleriaceae bacterium]